MPEFMKFALYLLVMAGVTYLVRMLPLVLVKHKIENRFIRSFLYYVPYSVLAVMTIPAIFDATPSLLSAIIGFTVALVLAYYERGLLTVALAGCGSVLATEVILLLIK